MAGLKKDLKDAREKRNLTVQQVAALTNIKTEHIRALEEGNYEFFSAPIYIRGFVRSIAIALKMDLAQTMSTLDLELEDEKHQLKNADLDTKTEESAVEDEEKVKNKYSHLFHGNGSLLPLQQHLCQVEESMDFF